MEQAKALFAATQGEVSSLKANVLGEIAGLGSVWQGDAYNRFNSAMNMWDQLGQGIITRLHEMELKMGQNIQQILGAADDSSRSAGDAGNIIEDGLHGI
jgi:WXG100 family type VII secretion target